MVVRTVPEPVGTFIAIPSDVYTARIGKIESEMKPPDIYNEGEYEQIAVTWEIDADDVDDGEEREGPITLRSWFKPSMNEKSNLVLKLLPALGLKPAAVGEEWDEQDWVGLSCLIQVEKFTNASGFDRNKIVSYMAIPKKKKRPALPIEREEDEPF